MPPLAFTARERKTYFFVSDASYLRDKEECDGHSAIAAKAGVSPETAKVALAAILPIVVSHFTHGGQQPAPQSGFSGMAPKILDRLL